MSINTGSNNIEQSDPPIVFADRDQNRYVNPVDTFKRRPVSVERKAKVGRALRELQ